MPSWLQNLMWAAGLVTALGILFGVPALVWKKIIRPGARLVHTMEEMLPLLRSLLAAFRDSPDGVFKVLQEIAKEFRTDSGSSLRDVANRLEETARVNQSNIEALQVGVEALKLIGSIDRDALHSLSLVIDRLGIRVDAGTATGLRMEEKASGIADDLILATKKVEGVAQDLADSHKRADETHHTLPAGSAADAAAQQTVREKILNEDS